LGLGAGMIYLLLENGIVIWDNAHSVFPRAEARNT
jgi:hypothetical protein